MLNKRLINTGEAAPTPAGLDPLQNFETVTYTGNGSTQKITGYIRKGAAFNGLQTSSASYIDISSSTTSTTSTVSFWINTTIKDSNFGNMFDAGGGSSGNTGFAIIRNPSNGYLRVNFTDGTTGSIEVFTGTTDITDGDWHHIVLSMASNNTFVLYLDGQPHISGTRTKFTSGDTHNLSNHRLGTNASSIGASSYGGKLDQVRIFNTALDSTQVGQLALEDYTDPKKSTTDYFGNGSGVALYELDDDAKDTGDTYNGTPTNVNFLGMAFQPDLVWIKERTSTSGHFISDSVRGATKVIYSNLTNSEDTETNVLTSFDTNGFTVGNSGGVNAGTDNYVAWCFKGGGTAVSNTDSTTGDTTSVSANPDAGFSIVSLSKTDTNTRTYGHGLSSTPEMIILKRTASADDWYVYHKDLGNTTRISLNSSAAKVTGTGVWGSTTPTSSVFTLQNQNGGAHIAYCFHSVDGYQKVGTYTGTGSSGNQVDVGFRPRFLMVKRTDSSGGWVILDSLRSQELYPHVSSAESVNSRLTINDDGFVTTGSAFNESGSANNFIYLAIA